MHLAERDKEISQAESIVQRIATGDKLAEQELVSTYYRGLIFILNRQTLSEDLIQDTFILVIQKARDNGITNPAALSAFIRQIGINLLIGHKRKVTQRDSHGEDNIEIHAPTDNMEISRALHSDKLLQITSQLLNELKTPRDKEFNVHTKKGFPFSAYWKERTREHFMTVSFYKNTASVGMSVQAWRIRQQDSDRLPVKDFKQGFRVNLK
jgi:DNA-directed RNA polymerase specialized sigma24 family protein